MRATLLFLATLAFAAPHREPAPNFHAVTTSGERFDNASVKGKIVLFEFWTTWCPYCAREQDILDDLQAEYADKGLVVLAVDVLEPKKLVRKYLAEHPRKTRIVFTEDTNLAAMFEAKAYPIYVILDRDGNVAGEQRGAAGREGLLNLLEKAGIKTTIGGDDDDSGN